MNAECSRFQKSWACYAVASLEMAEAALIVGELDCGELLRCV